MALEYFDRPTGAATDFSVEVNLGCFVGRDLLNAVEDLLVWNVVGELDMPAVPFFLGADVDQEIVWLIHEGVFVFAFRLEIPLPSNVSEAVYYKPTVAKSPLLRQQGAHWLVAIEGITRYAALLINSSVSSPANTGRVSASTPCSHFSSNSDNAPGSDSG